MEREAGLSANEKRVDVVVVVERRTAVDVTRRDFVTHVTLSELEICDRSLLLLHALVLP